MANPPLRSTTGPATLAEATAGAELAAIELARSTPDQRASWLRHVAGGLDDATDELVALAEEETSLSGARLRGEVARTTGQLRSFAEVLVDGGYLEVTIDHADPAATPPRPDLRRVLHPVGPVAVYAASNFPFAFSVAGGDTASALAAGCPVIVKAHPGHPRVSRRTAELVVDALRTGGAPEGTFGLVEGFETGRALIGDPVIRAAGFTGSLTGGRALFDLAVSRPDPIPFYGELSSTNPVVVTPGAAAARPVEIAQGLVASFTLGVGQFCTKPGLVFVPRDSGLEDAIVAAVADAPGGAMLDGRIAEGFRDGIDRVLGTGRVDVLAGDPATAVADGSARPVVAATSAEELGTADALVSECFGPLTLLVRYAGDAALASAIDHLPGSLTVSVHAEQGELASIAPLVRRLQELAGRLVFGGWPTGVAVSWAQHHGGPWPSTTSALHTSVGATAIRRFLRPLTYQDAPEELLPAVLRDDVTGSIPRRIDGRLVLPG